MDKWTMWLLRIGASVLILYFGWMWVEKAVLFPYQQMQRAAQVEAALAQCKGGQK